MPAGRTRVFPGKIDSTSAPSRELARDGGAHVLCAGLPADVASEKIGMREDFEDTLCGRRSSYISSVTVLVTTSAPAHKTSRLIQALRRIARPNLA